MVEEKYPTLQMLICEVIQASNSHIAKLITLILFALQTTIYPPEPLR
jgi:hypothetical protein